MHGAEELQDSGCTVWLAAEREAAAAASPHCDCSVERCLGRRPQAVCTPVTRPCTPLRGASAGLQANHCNVPCVPSMELWSRCRAFLLLRTGNSTQHATARHVACRPRPSYISKVARRQPEHS